MSRISSIAFSKTFKKAKNSLFKKKIPPKFIGEDYYGNKFFEMPLAADSTRKRPQRYYNPFQPGILDNRYLSTEWRAWLHYRRDDPPTMDELLHNKKMVDMKRQKYEEKKIAEGTISPTDHASGKNYPSYPEFSSTPGAELDKELEKLKE